MPWFKVDDRLHDHHKTRQVRRSHSAKRRDVAPFGLWTLAGSWCGSNPTHGFIPLEILQEWDEDAEELADRLVGARLWTSDEVNGEPGYRFHDWADRNPVDNDDPSDYGRRGNHIRWHEKRGVEDPECEFCPSDDRPDIGGESGADQNEDAQEIAANGTVPRSVLDSSPRRRPDVAPNRGGESSRPDPTRPDPKRTPAVRASDLDTDSDFVAFWSAYPRRTDKGHARRAWLAMLKAGHDPQKVIAGARAFADSRAGTETKFIPHPATWLNGERWTDEAMTAPQHTPPRDDADWMRRRPADG